MCCSTLTEWQEKYPKTTVIVFGGILVAGTAVSIYGLGRAITVKQTVDTAYTCFCSAVKNVSQVDCQEVLDYIYGEGLYPNNLKLFCGIKGSMTFQITSAKMQLGVAIGSVCAAALGIGLYGYGIFKNFCRQRSGYSSMT